MRNETYLEEDVDLDGFNGADDFIYCDECGEPLLEEDIVYEGTCNYCGDGNKLEDW